MATGAYAAAAGMVRSLGVICAGEATDPDVVGVPALLSFLVTKSLWSPVIFFAIFLSQCPNIPRLWCNAARFEERSVNDRNLGPSDSPVTKACDCPE